MIRALLLVVLSSAFQCAASSPDTDFVIPVLTSLKLIPNKHQQKASGCSNHCQLLLESKTAYLPPPACALGTALEGADAAPGLLVLWKEGSNSSQFRCVGNYCND